MALSRGRGSALSAPRVVTFGLSLVLVLLPLGSVLTHYPHSLAVVSAHRFALAVFGYAVLAVGVLLPGA